ncbi:hypothetical protein J437_LFUL010765 [Ladona fulva]|uniref:Exonuclease domain-containing protein n=1 Tax=Ladona fulva TaxID=123851 RepID=A0A8K0P361_LADFU|nr:hypothetical protein J437_LFUL010765 [Ladona fulva]
MGMLGGERSKLFLVEAISVMADAGIGLTEFPAITLTVIVGATVFVLIYISTLFKTSARPEEAKHKPKEHTKIKEKNEGLHGGAQHSKSTKKKYVGERWGRDTKHTFSHPWLMTSLKGHKDSEDPGGGEADGGEVLELENGSSGDSSGSAGETCSSSSSCDASSSNSNLSTLSSSSKNSTEDGTCEGDSEVGVDDKVAARSTLNRKAKRNRMRRDDDSGNGDSPVAPVRSRRKARGRAPKAQMTNSRARQNAGAGCGGMVKSKSETCGSNFKSSGVRLPILRQYAKLTLGDVELAALLRHYLLTQDQLLVLGYPVESGLYPGRAIIYKDPSGSSFPDQGFVPTLPSEPSRPAHLFDVNAREFVPRSNISAVEDTSSLIDYSAASTNWTVGHGSSSSLSSLPRNSTAVDGGSTSSPEVSVSSEEGCDLGDLAPQEDEEDDEDLRGMTVISSDVLCVEYVEGKCVERIVSSVRMVSASEEKRCVRCGRGFFVTNDGEYLTQERCVYHWGKLQKVVVNRAMPSSNNKGRSNQGLGSGTVTRTEFGCCGGRKGSRGCSVGRLHVWCGTGDGFNGPYGGYVKTQPQGKRVSSASSVSALVYALDCEMCFTGRGLELSKVTLVGIDGRPVYEALVRPGRPVVDHNTRFSGVTAGDLSRATKYLADVQKDLLALIHADTILVGHGLENDLRALRLIHGCVVDTAVVFPHYYGLPYRRSLRSLTASYLGREIQGSSAGHDSCEDARAAMEVMLWKVRRDFRSVLEN